MLLDVARESTDHATRFLQAAERSLGTALSVVTRLEGGRLARLNRTIRHFVRSSRGKIAMTVAGLVAEALGLIGLGMWWKHFLGLLAGGLPLILLLGGALAVYLGFEETKDKFLLRNPKLRLTSLPRWLRPKWKNIRRKLIA